MLDGAAFLSALPQLGLGGLLMLVFFVLVYRSPLYLERRIEASQYKRMDERMQKLEASEQECRRELNATKGRVAELEGYMMGRGRADQEAQRIVSIDRLTDRRGESDGGE